MSYLSYPKHLGAACFFGLFGFYFVAFHLPMRYGVMFSRGKTISDQFKIDPLFFRSIFGFESKSHLVKRCGEEEKMWVVPMLVGQAILIPTMYYQINLDFLINYVVHAPCTLGIFFLIFRFISNS